MLLVADLNPKFETVYLIEELPPEVAAWLRQQCYRARLVMLIGENSPLVIYGGQPVFPPPRSTNTPFQRGNLSLTLAAHGKSFTN